MFRSIILIITLVIIAGLVFSRCSNSVGEGEETNPQSFENYLRDALARQNTSGVSESISFSMRELFGSESEVYKRNLEQIAMKQKMRYDFESLLLGSTQLPSLYLTDDDIEKKLERERRKNPLYSNTLARQRNTQSGNPGDRNQDCAGIFYDPCLEVDLSIQTHPSGTLYDNITVYPKRNTFDTLQHAQNIGI